MESAVIISCEHASNAVAPGFEGQFRGADSDLASHRGWDIGAIAVAEALAAALNAPLHAGEISRLLIDLNRSLHHPRLYSEYSRDLPSAQREELIEHWYMPYRMGLERAIRKLRQRGQVVHLSVHSFTPELEGDTRSAELALLYDPARPAEKQFAEAWLADARERLPKNWRLRRNYPYRGTADSLTTAMREQWPDPYYLGIELEMNQALLGEPRFASELGATLAEVTAQTLRQTGP